MGLKEPVITDAQVLTSHLTTPSPPICKGQSYQKETTNKSIENKTDKKGLNRFYISTSTIFRSCQKLTLSNKMKQSHTYATGGFEGTCYNRCVGSYLSSYRPFSSNLQQLVTPKNAVKNEQDTSLPWSNSPATAPKCWVKLLLFNLPSI